MTNDVAELYDANEANTHVGASYIVGVPAHVIGCVRNNVGT